jgi:hypothetical protein
VPHASEDKVRVLARLASAHTVRAFHFVFNAFSLQCSAYSCVDITAAISDDLLLSLFHSRICDPRPGSKQPYRIPQQDLSEDSVGSMTVTQRQKVCVHGRLTKSVSLESTAACKLEPSQGSSYMHGLVVLLNPYVCAVLEGCARLLIDLVQSRLKRWRHFWKDVCT